MIRVPSAARDAVDALTKRASQGATDGRGRRKKGLSGESIQRRPFRSDAGFAIGAEWLGTEEAGVPRRGSGGELLAALEQRHRRAATRELERATDSDRAAADDHDLVLHAERMAQRGEPAQLDDEQTLGKPIAAPALEVSPASFSKRR